VYKAFEAEKEATESRANRKRTFEQLSQSEPLVKSELMDFMNLQAPELTELQPVPEEQSAMAFTSNVPNVAAIKAQSKGQLKGYAKCLDLLIGIQEEQSIEVKCDPDSIDTWVGLELQSIDPYLVEGFECKICRTELNQRYAHCRGCEVLLQKDWNVCLQCLGKKEHLQHTAASSVSSRAHGPVQRRAHNPHRKIVECEECHKCVCCQCTCHQQFEVRYRFELPNDRTRLRQWSQLCLEDKPLSSVDFSAEFNSKEEANAVASRASKGSKAFEEPVAQYTAHSKALVLPGRQPKHRPSVPVAMSRTKHFDKNEGRADLAAVWGFPQGSMAYIACVYRPNKSRLPHAISLDMGGTVQYVLDGRLVVHFESDENIGRTYLECKFTKAESKACLRGEGTEAWRT